MINKGARIDERDMLGQTPLHAAASHGRKKAAICLLDHKAEINAVDNDGFTPLMFAAQQNFTPLLDLLLVRGADPNLVETGGQTALHNVSRINNFEIAQRLIEGGAAIDLRDEKGATPLLLAAQEGFYKIVKLLVKAGANIYLADCYGMTPLISATFCRRSEVVDYLVKMGADLDNQGNAVGMACKSCRASDVPVFKCAGCKVVWYCSPECQKKDWKEGGENRHKTQCPRIKEQRERYGEKKKVEAEIKAWEIDARLQIERKKDIFRQMTMGDGASSSRQG